MWLSTATTGEILTPNKIQNVRLQGKATNWSRNAHFELWSACVTVLLGHAAGRIESGSRPVTCWSKFQKPSSLNNGVSTKAAETSSKGVSTSTNTQQTSATGYFPPTSLIKAIFPVCALHLSAFKCLWKSLRIRNPCNLPSWQICKIFCKKHQSRNLQHQTTDAFVVCFITNDTPIMIWILQNSLFSIFGIMESGFFPFRTSETINLTRSRDNSAQRQIWAGRATFDSRQGEELSLLHSVQISSGIHPSS